MRRTKLIRESGPYKVESHASGNLSVVVGWSQYAEEPETDGRIGGPLTRLALAADIERLLNDGKSWEEVCSD